MITKELIDQINHLARKSRATGLTSEEKLEQAKLRRQYLDGIREQIIASLEQVKRPEEHSDTCNCGCHANKLH